MPNYPDWFVKHLKEISASKRAQRVIEHILQHGSISTEELADMGYAHPPRAARDVRELGIPLKTVTSKDSQGKTIAAYTFGDPNLLRPEMMGGRKRFPATVKKRLIKELGAKCAICGNEMLVRDLQIDHKIPYEVAGEPSEYSSVYFMLLCRNCQRAKSWSCEHCPNFSSGRPEICLSCYWANPNNYTHVATQPIRRVDLQWVGQEEVLVYDEIKGQAIINNLIVPDFVKEILKRHIRKDSKSQE
jgi:hypothetical protein